MIFHYQHQQFYRNNPTWFACFTPIEAGSVMAPVLDPRVELGLGILLWWGLRLERYKMYYVNKCLNGDGHVCVCVIKCNQNVFKQRHSRTYSHSMMTCVGGFLLELRSCTVCDSDLFLRLVVLPPQVAVLRHWHIMLMAGLTPSVSLFLSVFLFLSSFSHYRNCQWQRKNRTSARADILSPLKSSKLAV